MSAQVYLSDAGEGMPPRKTPGNCAAGSRPLRPWLTLPSSRRGRIVALRFWGRGRKSSCHRSHPCAETAIRVDDLFAYLPPWPCRLTRSLLLFATALVAAPVAATDGFYDPSFGSGGRHLFAMLPLDGLDQAKRLRILADGTLLLGGTCNVNSLNVACLAWYHGDGTDLNHSYGPGGSGKSFPNNFSGFVQNTLLFDLALLPDGRIVLLLGDYAGESYLAILRADGTDLDRSVGGGKGWTTCNLNGNGSPFDSGESAIAVQRDGKILVAGGFNGANNNYDMAVVRFLPDLSGFDPNFFGGNVQTVAFELGGASGESADTVAVQSDDKILLAGYAATETAFARLLPNGLPDNSSNNPGAGFGPLKDGRAHYAFGTLADVVTVLLDRYGRIVFGGLADGQWLIGRLLADGGSQDPAFNGGSARQFLFQPGITGTQAILGMARQSDGKILAAGYAPRSTNSVTTFVAAARLLADGSFDSDFGFQGRATATFTDASFGCCGYTDSGEAIAVGDGGIVLAGWGQAVMNGGVQFGIARVLLDLVFTDPFE